MICVGIRSRTWKRCVKEEQKSTLVTITKPASYSTHSSYFSFLFTMVQASSLFTILSGLLVGALANPTNSADAGSNCCKFTLSSPKQFDCPAGELLDGQIRLNGTYETSTFCLDKEGGITNSRGFGCIVTGTVPTYRLFLCKCICAQHGPSMTPYM